MCLSVPGRVTQVNGAMVEVETEGRTGWYNALSQPEIAVGDYVLTHANLVVGIISEEEALRMREAARELAEALEREEGGGAGAPGDEGNQS